jgi:hypothetical protein
MNTWQTEGEEGEAGSNTKAAHNANKAGDEPRCEDTKAGGIHRLTQMLMILSRTFVMLSIFPIDITMPMPLNVRAVQPTSVTTCFPVVFASLQFLFADLDTSMSSAVVNPQQNSGY